MSLSFSISIYQSGVGVFPNEKRREESIEIEPKSSKHGKHAEILRKFDIFYSSPHRLVLVRFYIASRFVFFFFLVVYIVISCRISAALHNTMSICI